PFIAIVKLTTGKDGRPSTSKFQLILWTFVVIFAYVVLYAMRLQRGDGSAINQIPGTVLLALGVSIGTTTLARGITSSQVARGKVAKKKRDETPDGKARHLLQDDDDEVDLSKIQLLAWTLIAAGIFLIAVGHTVRGRNG